MIGVIVLSSDNRKDDGAGVLHVIKNKLLDQCNVIFTLHAVGRVDQTWQIHECADNDQSVMYVDDRTKLTVEVERDH